MINIKESLPLLYNLSVEKNYNNARDHLRVSKVYKLF